MNCGAIIVAAGRGTRLQVTKKSKPKQYLELSGRTILHHAVHAFLSHPKIDLVQVVFHPLDIEFYKSAVEDLVDNSVLEGCLKKLQPPVTGGATRQDSVLAGLQALLPAKPDQVLIHDAARPFVSRELLDRVLEGLKRSRAVLPGLPVSDTLKKEDNGHVTGTLDRTGLWCAQTPQGFHFDIILEAHRAAKDSRRLDFTDDSSIAEWHGIDVELVPGDIANFKLTTSKDFDLAEEIMKARAMKSGGSIKTGSGFDVHAFEDGKHVVLCGVKIPHSKKLKGHSDADVGLHALTDAILGALGQGDIGTHFPPDDPKWAGKGSDIFLKDALNRLPQRNGEVRHVDVTLICESPKIGPYREAMRQRIAEILEIDLENTSVKATTTEQLGFTGRKEGIAAMATATIWVP